MNEVSGQKCDPPAVKVGQIGYVEIFRDRIIEIRRAPEDEEFYGKSVLWQGFYRKISERISADHGIVYELAEDCLVATRQLIAWEADEELLNQQIKDFFIKLEAAGFSQAALLNALANISYQSGWGAEITQCLDEAALKAPGSCGQTE